METPVKSTIAQEAKPVKIGNITFLVKPFNFTQMQEISDIMRQVNMEQVNDSESLLSFCFKRPDTLKALQEIAIKVVFRGSLKRFMVGWYVRKHLDITAWKAIFETIVSQFDYRFFFQSLISLKGMIQDKKASTNEVPAPGE